LYPSLSMLSHNDWAKMYHWATPQALIRTYQRYCMVRLIHLLHRFILPYYSLISESINWTQEEFRLFQATLRITCSFRYTPERNNW
jgi:hypothetical protein